MKYLRKFKSIEDANAEGAKSLSSPQLNYVAGKSVVNSYVDLADTFYAEFDEDGKMNAVQPQIDAVYFNIISGSVKLPSSGSYEYSFDGKNWHTAIASHYFETSFYLRGKNSRVGVFSIGGEVSISGNGMTLIDYETIPDTVPSYGFKGSFAQCSGLTAVSENFLPATTLGSYCYSDMFLQCINLLESPLIAAPTLVTGCCGNMFQGCSNLHIIKCAATNLGGQWDFTTSSWVYGVATTGDFYCPEGVTWSTGIDGIPTKWTRHNL